MSKAVEGVECKGESSHRFNGKLSSNRKSAKARSNSSGVNGDTNGRENNETKSSQVEGTGKSKAGNSVQRRQNHCDFGLVNGQMGRDGSVGSLLLEDCECFIFSRGDSRQGSCKSLLAVE